jgi:SHS family lactate transporter-like MFS transporter
VPVHLNELSPDAVRGTFPGFTYQLGNLLASANATMQAGIAEHYEGDYAFALAVVVAPVAVALVLLVLFGPEAKGIQFGRFADLDHLGPPSEQPPDRGVGGSC